MLINNFLLLILAVKYKKESMISKSMNDETDVSKEYLKAFRTKSYLDICHKVQNHMGLDKNESSSPSSTSLIRDHYIRKCDILFEPQNETMANLAKTVDHHCLLLLDFFDAGSEAWKICEQMLMSIHQLNANDLIIKRVINLSENVPKSDQQHITIYKELAFYSSLMNPLSGFSPQNFPKIQNHLKLLLKRLTTNRTRIERKRKLIICLKKTTGCALVASYTIIAIALIVLAFHGLVGIVASPALIACSLGLTKKANAAQKGLKTAELKRVGLVLDVAAKGVYTLIKDLDTIGSLVGRLHDEVEFGKGVARKCVGKLKSSDVLDEVVRECRVHESRFTEQLEELKDYVYLCLLNVNRSRMLLVEEILPRI
ncbi:UPF0496 protein At1g20180-like [Rutidosis leptorrhynchoides]|uniref:UPF0496 protein At1g20180-like n=1 Tax=Rutidosis leptorrhynchoides TaxID=125765 RepID=UPI003A9981A2